MGAVFKPLPKEDDLYVLVPVVKVRYSSFSLPLSAFSNSLSISRALGSC